MSPGLCGEMESVGGVRNTVALVGTPVTLYCSTRFDAKTYSWLRQYEERGASFCFECELCNYFTDFVFTRTPLGCNLMVPSAPFRVAGVYIGAALGYLGVTAQLIVLGKIFKHYVSYFYENVKPEVV